MSLIQLLARMHESKVPPEFLTLEAPKYKPAQRGEWVIKQVPHGPNIVRLGECTGYWTLHSKIKSKTHWAMLKGDTVWMSLTPMELESQGYHARFAFGEVMVMGLGMGALLYNLLKNPSVNFVTVVEKDPQVVSLLRQSAPWLRQSERFNIITADALHVKAMSRIDTLIIDIWPRLGDENMERDIDTITKNTNPGVIGFWGQELAMISWLNAHGYRSPVTSEQITAYENHIGYCLLGARHPEYPRLVLQAALTLSAISEQKMVQ